jgi:ribosomal protein L29
MKVLKTQDLRLKSKKELLSEVDLISKNLMKLKILKEEENNNNKVHIFCLMRKNISRILTILSEKK